MTIENKIQENIPLASLTSYKIGGPAEFFVKVKTGEDLSGAVAWARENKKEINILGGGSNILVNDSGIKGLVIYLDNKEVTAKGDRIESGAGGNLGQVVSVATRNSLSGMEWAAGVPGTVGGAVRGNAGCFGSDMSEVIETVKTYNTKKYIFDLYSNRLCNFLYRASVFKINQNLIVWATTFKLSEGKLEEISERIEEIISKRSVAFPSLPSAGSVFKNLYIDDIRKMNLPLAEVLIERGVVRNGKVGAKWIIGELDLAGKTIGGAKISLEHANFIINTGKASADNVAALISYIKQRVRNTLKIQLEEEIQYFGF